MLRVLGWVGGSGSKCAPYLPRHLNACDIRQRRSLHAEDYGGQATLRKTLVTDARGEARLGDLAGVSALRATCAAPPRSGGVPPPPVVWALNPDGGTLRGLPTTMSAVYKPGGRIYVPYPWTGM